jgi:hypothetical protein
MLRGVELTLESWGNFDETARRELGTRLAAAHQMTFLGLMGDLQIVELERAGIRFVLVPGGSFSAGVRNPPRVVDVAPFLCARTPLLDPHAYTLSA